MAAASAAASACILVPVVVVVVVVAVVVATAIIAHPRLLCDACAASLCLLRPEPRQERRLFHCQ